MPIIAGQGITSGTITLYEQGDWFGDVYTNSDDLIANGTRVEIVVENVTLSGAIVHGGISGDVGRYQLAGRPEWGNPIKKHADDLVPGIPFSVIFGDVMRETLGSSWKTLVVAPPDATLKTSVGEHYQRAGTSGSTIVLARDVLNSLGLDWYVRNDGITVFGTRSTGDVTTQDRILVSDRNDAIGLRYVNCDDVAAFIPGLTFEGETIGEISYIIEPEDVSLQVWTRAASNAPLDWLRGAWRRLFPRVELQGLYSYSTAGLASNFKHSLRSTGSRHVPDINLADAWTIAGHTSELVPGTRVLVAFADGNPAKPVIVAVDPSTLPSSSTFEAVDTLSADASSIEFGAAEAPVLRAGDTVILTGALVLGGPNTVVITHNPTDPPTIIPTKVKA